MDYSKEIKDYASAIHRLTCNCNHTDQCGWMYGEFQRSYEYRDAEKMLPELKKIATPEQLHAIADIIRPWTKDWR